MKVILQRAQPVQDPSLRTGIYVIAPGIGCLSNTGNPTRITGGASHREARHQRNHTLIT